MLMLVLELVLVLVLVLVLELVLELVRVCVCIPWSALRTLVIAALRLVGVVQPREIGQLIDSTLQSVPSFVPSLSTPKLLVLWDLLEVGRCCFVALHCDVLTHHHVFCHTTFALTPSAKAST
jgi:hypothetical protein